MDVVYFRTPAGRMPAWDFLEGLPLRFQQQIRADVDLFARFGARAPVSTKPIKGHRGLFELRVGPHRVFYMVTGATMVLLGGCKKQDQDREIAACAARIKVVRKEPLP